MESIKKVLILSTSHPYRTSGIVAHDIFKGFKQNGYQTKLVVENFDKYEDGIVSVHYYYEILLKKIKNRIRKLYFKIFNIKYPIDTLRDYHFDGFIERKRKYATKRILNKVGFKPDVIVIIFSQNFISFKNLKELQAATNAPIIWQFADMFPFTGGCHYAWDCNGYKNLCENCPGILENFDKNRTHIELLEKIEYAKDLNIIPVIGSDWLIDRAKLSTLFKNAEIKKIYLSLDTNFFKPYDDIVRQKIREKYNINRDDHVILIMATYLSHKRKGIDLILEAFSSINEEFIKNKNCHLVVVGAEFDSVKKMIPSYLPHTHIDSIDRDLLPEIYNMSDLFVSASLQEVGPYTLTEALLCSVPVVSLDHGYANEFVINNETGILVKDDLPSSIAKGITEMIEVENQDLIKIKGNCRSRTAKIVSKNKQIEEYIKLINNLNYEVR